MRDFAPELRIRRVLAGASGVLLCTLGLGACTQGPLGTRGQTPPAPQGESLPPPPPGAESPGPRSSEAPGGQTASPGPGTANGPLSEWGKPAKILGGGSVKFNAVLFTNMENRAHATDDGNYVIVRDSHGQAVAMGPMTLDAATSGKQVGGMGYPVTQLNVKASVRDGLGSAKGQGTLSICRVTGQEPRIQDAKCDSRRPMHGDERPYEWRDVPVEYEIRGSEIFIENDAGMIGSGPSVAGGLSFAYPVAMGAVGAEVNDYQDVSSPLVFDLNGNGQLDLVSLEEGVLFDHRGSGLAERSGWVDAGDGLLVLDTNKNGRVDSGRELFGEYSYRRGADPQEFVSFENGLLALAQYDSRRDGVINRHDSVFGSLRIWLDRDRDGVSQASELKTLNELGIEEIRLSGTKQGRPFAYPTVAGNEVRLIGEFVQRGKVQKLGDVWFRTGTPMTAKR